MPISASVMMFLLLHRWLLINYMDQLSRSWRNEKMDSDYSNLINQITTITTLICVYLYMISALNFNAFAIQKHVFG